MFLAHISFEWFSLVDLIRLSRVYLGFERCLYPCIWVISQQKSQVFLPKLQRKMSLNFSLTVVKLNKWRSSGSFSFVRVLLQFMLQHRCDFELIIVGAVNFCLAIVFRICLPKAKIWCTCLINSILFACPIEILPYEICQIRHVLPLFPCDVFGASWNVNKCFCVP